MQDMGQDGVITTIAIIGALAGLLTALYMGAGLAGYL